jgi:hypothetical protein
MKDRNLMMTKGDLEDYLTNLEKKRKKDHGELSGSVVSGAEAKKEAGENENEQDGVEDGEPKEGAEAKNEEEHAEKKI